MSASRAIRKYPFTIISAVITVSLITFIFFGRGFLVSEDQAINALESAGYSGIQITNTHRFFPAMRGCASEDAVAFKAQVTNPVGNQTNVTVCIGWPVKDATIRH